MTTLLRRAIEKAQRPPPEMQDDIARLMLAYAGNERSVIQLTPEEDAD